VSRSGDDCPFCAVVTGESAARVVFADDHVVAFLDRSPVFKGHVLVVPRQHVTALPDLAVDELQPIFTVVQHIATVVPDALAADGTFVAINNVVSQSVAHLHVHVVPRRRKDGLRGFFWPRQKYDSEEAMAEIAAKLRTRLG
jgi:histidine triad (HIT) family protein